MKRFMLVMLLLGTALLGVILWETDLGEVWGHLRQLGGWTLVLVIGVYGLGSLCLSGSWLLTLMQVPPTPRWLSRIFRVWLVGTALEYVTPLASLGGEPAKAILLKRHYGVRIRDATTSLVLTRMTDLVAQIVFMAIGLGLMLQAELLPLPYRIAAGSGLGFLALGATFFFVAQRSRSLTRLRGWLDRGWLKDRSLSATARTALDALHDIDDRLLSFYSSGRSRFLLSTAAAFAEWTASAFVTWIALNAFGFQISIAEALIIESFVTVVRSTLFFVPADLGTQDGALVLICSAITGSPAVGLALATVRRTRDVLWIAVGLAIGSHYHANDLRGLEQMPEPEPATAPGFEVQRAD